MSLLLVVISWAALSKVDVVSTATGQIVPAGGGKIVQPLEAATVKAIDVHDGQIVRKGQVLVELDPIETLSDRDRLQGELDAARMDVARLQAVALGRPFTPPSGAVPATAAIAEREVEAEIAQNAAQSAAMYQQVEQHKAELASAKAEEERLKALLPLSLERTQAFTTLQKAGFGARLQLIEAQEKEQDTERSLEVQHQKIPALQATIAATERQRAEAAAETTKTLAALTDAQVKAASLAEALSEQTSLTVAAVI